MKLSFHGAAHGVTGSCHLVECAGRRLLVDCGLYQGGRELDEENADPFGFDPAAVDYVLLTHAHLDHCGRLPLLAKRGFRGEIITTAATRELARLVLLDAGHLQEEDAHHRARQAARHGAPAEAGAPLYTVLDALNSLDALGRTARYGQPVDLAPGPPRGCARPSWTPGTSWGRRASSWSSRRPGAGRASSSPATSATPGGRSCATRPRLRRRTSS